MRAILYAVLQVGLDLLDHLGVLLFGQVSLARVHGEDAAVLKLTLILRHEMEVQVAAGVAVGAIVDLLGRKGGVDGLGGAVHIGKVGVALLVGDVHDLADVILIGHDAAARMALLLEEDQLGDAQISDEDAEGVEQFALHAVAAVAVFHGKIPLSIILLVLLYTIDEKGARRNCVKLPRSGKGGSGTMSRFGTGACRRQ